MNRRGISTFTLLGGSVLLGCLILSAILLAMQFQQASAQVERERDNTFQLNRALMQAVFNGHLEAITLQLTNLINQEELSHFDASSSHLDQIHIPLRQLEQQNQTRHLDRLILATADNSHCHDHSETFFQSDCRELIQQYDNPLYRWHLYKTTDEVGLLTREPLVNRQSGQVMGYLYAGVVISNNFGLLNKVNNALGDRKIVAALATDGVIQSSNVRLDSEQTSAVYAALQQPNTAVRTGQMIGRSENLLLDHEFDRLRLVTLVNADNFDQLSQRMIDQTLAAVALGTLLAVVLSMIAVKLTLQPLIALLHFTRSNEPKEELPKPGILQEINQISSYLARHVAELNRSRDQLRRYSNELEVTHAEVHSSNLALHRQTRELEQTNQRLESLMEHNKTLLHQLFHLQEEERKHLAQELHDQLGQTLAAVSTDAYLIKSQLPSNSPAYLSATSIYNRAQEMYDVVYNRIVSLRPLPLNDLGLSEAIRHMPVLNQLRNQNCTLELDLPSIPRLQGEIEISLFRVAQEAVTNALKHAEATELAISLSFHDGCLRLLVRDNGHGFEPHNQPAKASMGIGGMRERCHAIGGTLQLISNRSGTSIQAIIPLPADSLVTA